MGPLKGIKVVELAGIGPGPFCAMMLGDMRERGSTDEQLKATARTGARRGPRA